MADNTELASGSGGDTLATDDIGSVKYPRSKIVIGADGTNDGDVSAANPLPITGTVTAVTSITNDVSIDDGGNTITVDGTVTANLGATDNAVLDSIATNTTGLNGCVSGSELQVDIVSSAALDVSAATVTVDNGGTFAVQIDGDALTALQLIDDAVAAEGAALGKGVLLQGDDGTDRTNVLVDTAGHVQVDAVSCASHAVTNAGTFAVQVDGDALTALQKIDDPVSGSEMLIAGGATQTNDVKVTLDGEAVNLSATDNTVLDNIDTNTTGLAGCVDGTELQVDVVGSISAGTNVIGQTISNAQSDKIYDGTTSCTIKRAAGLAASGTVAMVGAVAGKKIRVLALFLKATSATVTNIYVANGDNDILGDSTNPIPLAVDADGDNDSGFVLPWNPGGWCETDTVNEALNVVLSAAQDVIYALTYIEVD